ncbi:MAG: GIY-YIG nuclease family protein [Gammaproteobacteria bacterium]|nr:GIY-YIG nuclease family protein [Gammaproteobacteria bacterium]
MSTDQKNWSVYILRCSDNSLYTGVALDVHKRLAEHNGIEKKGAKYTHARRPVTLVYQELSDSRSDACKREYEIKNLTKLQKETLIRQQPTIKHDT